MKDSYLIKKAKALSIDITHLSSTSHSRYLIKTPKGNLVFYRDSELMMYIWGYEDGRYENGSKKYIYTC